MSSEQQDNNKLTKIMKSNKKEGYSKQLEENRSNIKNTCKILNAIIKNWQEKAGLSKHPLTKNSTMKDMALSWSEVEGKITPSQDKL